MGSLARQKPLTKLTHRRCAGLPPRLPIANGRGPGSEPEPEPLSGPLLGLVQHASRASDAPEFGGKDGHGNSLKDTEQSFQLFSKCLILLRAEIPLRALKHRSIY